MIRVRNGSAFASGMTATGFWLGITVGRVILGFVTARVGEKLAIAVRTPGQDKILLKLLVLADPKSRLTLCSLSLVDLYFGLFRNSMLPP